MAATTLIVLARTTGARRDELAGELRTTPALFRLLRRTKDGKLRISKGAVANEARFDGKFLLRTSDDTLTPAGLAAACKQLYQVETGQGRAAGAAEPSGCPVSSPACRAAPR